jgi:hypothetical protein
MESSGSAHRLELSEIIPLPPNETISQQNEFISNLVQLYPNILIPPRHNATSNLGLDYGISLWLQFLKLNDFQILLRSDTLHTGFTLLTRDNFLWIIPLVQERWKWQTSSSPFGLLQPFTENATCIWTSSALEILNCNGYEDKPGHRLGRKQRQRIGRCDCLFNFFSLH